MKYAMIVVGLLALHRVLPAGPGWTVLVGVLVAIQLILLYLRLSYRQKLRWYGDRLENIYEVQRSPSDKEVVVRAREHDEWLKLSGNKMGVKVVTIFFQDSRNPSEEWEEYLERAKEEIALDRQVRHQAIERSEGRDYYLREMHGQRGIRLPEEGPDPEAWWVRLLNRTSRRA